MESLSSLFQVLVYVHFSALIRVFAHLTGKVFLQVRRRRGKERHPTPLSQENTLNSNSTTNYPQSWTDLTVLAGSPGEGAAWMLSGC